MLDKNIFFNSTKKLVIDNKEYVFFANTKNCLEFFFNWGI